ncbi:MAG: hypothetical protein WBA13_04555 [Microcoleaceae cyanobacterium]
MLRKLIISLMCFSLCWTTVACGSPNSTATYSTQPQARTVAATTNQPTAGEYPLQQAQYDDANGEYTFMLLNTPSGKSPVFRTSDVQMARLSDDDIAAGKQSYLEVKGDTAIAYISEDFKIEYVHNVTETVTNPQTGQPQTVVVRQQSSFWTPFAASIAGNMVANALFAPRYYVPPVYQPGRPLTGVGGYGNTYQSAVSQYQTRYNQPPAAVKNRQTLRTTGAIRNNSTPRNTSATQKRDANRSTGSGFGSSNLKQNNNGSSTTKKRTPGFGSSSPSRRRTPSFGGRRRR